MRKDILIRIVENQVNNLSLTHIIHKKEYWDNSCAYAIGDVYVKKTRTGDYVCSVYRIDNEIDDPVFAEIVFNALESEYKRQREPIIWVCIKDVLKSIRNFFKTK